MNVMRKSSTFILTVALIAAIVGWVETRPSLLLYLNTFDPMTLLVIWYVVVLAPLSWFVGRGLFGQKFNPRYVLAFLMVFWAFEILYYYPASGYVGVVTGQNAPTILEASEDGATYYVLMQYIKDPGIAAFLTYTVIPPVLILGAAFIASPQRVSRELRRLSTRL